LTGRLKFLVPVPPISTHRTREKGNAKGRKEMSLSEMKWKDEIDWKKARQDESRKKVEKKV
jgi:hypothetical protein